MLLDIAAATEAGRIINPLAMAGQIQGGVAMSVGYAFGENCQFKEGRLLNDSMSTYLMPTAMDLPRIQSLHVDGYEPWASRALQRYPPYLSLRRSLRQLMRYQKAD